MKELYVLKNHCGIDGVNEYILINIQDKTQSKLKASYGGLKHLLKDFSYEPIAPYKYKQYMEYEEVSTGMLLPLPI